MKLDFGEDTSSHDTACDCKGCLLNEWASDNKAYEAEIRELKERIWKFEDENEKLEDALSSMGY